MTDEGLNQSVFGALPLSYGVVAKYDAGGTRTHNIRLVKHGLQLGSRSWTQSSDEGVGQRYFRTGIEPANRRGDPQTHWTESDGLQTGSRCVSVVKMPNEVMAEISPLPNGLARQWARGVISERLRPLTSRSPGVATLGSS